MRSPGSTPSGMRPRSPRSMRMSSLGLARFAWPIAVPIAVAIAISIAGAVRVCVRRREVVDHDADDPRARNTADHVRSELSAATIGYAAPGHEDDRIDVTEQRNRVTDRRYGGGVDHQHVVRLPEPKEH